EVAQQLLDSPGREALVYVHEGRAVAHLTMMADSHDEVSGRDQVEMIDGLTDNAHGQRTAQRNLVNAAAKRADERRWPWGGSVVQRASGRRDDGRGRRMRRRRRERGWPVPRWVWSGTRGTGTEAEELGAPPPWWLIRALRIAAGCVGA